MLDYLEHYQADAVAIQHPEALSPLRQTSEFRRLQALRRHLGLQPGEGLLDCGCGSGWFADLCRQAGVRVEAMDVALAGVQGARTRFPGVTSFQVGDVYHLPFAGEVFDAVVLSEVVEHLENIPDALAEVQRVLRAGGRALISVPYREKILQHLCVHCNRFTPGNAHLHSFDERSLADCFESADMEVYRTVLLTNKLLELARFPAWSRRWPYAIWRLVDAGVNRVIGKPAFLCMLARKRS